MEQFRSYNMNTQLGVENKHMPEQDEFYRKMGAEFVRHDYNDTKNGGREKQQKDIDLTLILKNGRQIEVSEKYRNSNHGDMLIEISSNWEKNINGWSLKGEANVLMYFVGDKYNPYVGEFNEEHLRNFEKKYDIAKNLKERYTDLINSMIRVRREYHEIFLPFDSRDIKCALILAFNNVNTPNQYTTVSVGVPFRLLDENDVSYRFLDWNGNILDKTKQRWIKL